jgi:dipeptidyl aminopeptidase/acylaminoacyl peptidase
VKPIVTGPGNYRNFAFDRTEEQFLFASDKDDFGKDSAQFAFYVGSMRTGRASPVLNASMMPASVRMPTSVSFNRNATALTFTMALPPDEAIPADSLVGKADFDLWHWKDPQLQPQQKLRINQERQNNYQGIYYLATKKLVQLTNDSVSSVTLSGDGLKGISSDGSPYTIERMWQSEGSDLYYVDPVGGSRKLIRRKISGSGSLSPDAKYVIFFDRGAWFTYNTATAKETNITGHLTGVHFQQETYSTPGTPSPWGIAAWTKGDSSVLIYDRFDVWQIDPMGVKPAVVVTDSVGRRERITFRLSNFERPDASDDPAYASNEGLFLSAFDEDTKESGFYRDRLGAAATPVRVMMDNLRYGSPSKARNADVFMITKSTFVDFPNIWVGNSLTTMNNRISDANPWQSEYRWGTAELVSWLSSDGVPLQGILYKPEGFDPSQKYPMVSYFYEELSDGLHNYIAPNGRNTINPTHYVSNGYFVFEPDIHYELGHPGPSAVKSIVPGVQKLLERGYIDPQGLGLQGQSWGGYQTAFIITQSQMFSGAMAGAPVANMTSAYGGIRWGSGLARAFQYEDGQSRIGQSLFDGLDLYLANSPLFHLERVTTPLFIMHNDQDDAVPWYQGIELFVGMRRLGKEVYMINYNNDVHNPASRANQKDIAMRMQQFFDATLKKLPQPDWMANGIPAKDKGKDLITPPPVTPPVTIIRPE